MPITYSEADKRYWYYQPQLTRWRHRYRGPRESLKINQEIGQLLYDLTKIKQRNDELLAELDYYTDIMQNGWDFDGDVDYTDYSSSTTFAPAELPGNIDLASRIESLRNRVRGLE
jgi:hypothetical protein